MGDKHVLPQSSSGHKIHRYIDDMIFKYFPDLFDVLEWTQEDNQRCINVLDQSEEVLGGTGR